MMKGVFTLQTSHDLLMKLESDYSALVNDHNNPYIAYNFFVTAEHMLDWVYPGYDNDGIRKSERNSELLLQVCSHLASGAKHFVAEAAHHKSVSNTVRKRPGNPLSGPLGGPLVQRSGKSGLYINLSGDALKQLGSSICVLDLAKQILEHWQGHKEFRNAVT